MAEIFKFELVSPERLLVSAEVTEVIVPGAEGYFTVLPRHAPFVATLRPGVLQVPGLKTKFSNIYVRSGIADVSPDGVLTILAEKAVPVEEMNAALYDSEIKVLEDLLDIAKEEDAKAQAAFTLERLRELREELGLAAAA
ncbi:MAG: F0F1 ATP synthase subunit epsilon [Alphaproteobacteria bacterium]|jgi:F-type H+-transporting ATPase subunit epsilon